MSDGHAMEYLNLNVGVLDAFENQNPQIHTEANATILENELFVLELNASDPDGDTLVTRSCMETIPSSLS